MARMDPEVLQLLRDLRCEMNARFDRLERLLFGNGGEGLVREVTKNTEFRERFESRYRVILGAAISALLSALVGLARSFLR